MILVIFGLVLIYAAASAGAGVLFLRAIAGSGWNDLLESHSPLLATSLLAGQALVASVWTLLGLAGWFKPGVLWTCIALLVALGAPLLAQVARRSMSAFLGVVSELRSMSWWLRVLALLLAVLVAGFGIAAWLKGPVGDGEAFYMAYAKVIADAQRLVPMPGLYTAFSTIGLIGELHFAALMQVGHAGAAKLFVWLLGLAGAAILAAICRRSGIGAQGRLVALVMLFTTTAFTTHIFDGKVDLVAAVLGLCAVYWALAAEGNAGPVALPLSGLCTGFAVVAKFSYLLAFVPAILVLVGWQWLAPALAQSSANRRFRAMAPLLVFGAWAALAIVPHVIKNTVLFGAPFAPLLGGPQDKNWLQQVWFSPDVTRHILITYPLALTFGRYPMQGGNISFLLLAFAPLVWWLPRPQALRDSVLFRLCVAGAAGTACWMILRPSVIAPRYLLATLLLFIPAVARAAQHALLREAPPRWLSGGIAACLAAALTIFAYPLAPLPRALSLYSRGELSACALASTYCEPLQRVNMAAARGDRIFLLNYYDYWLRSDLLRCRDSYDDDRILRKRGGSGLTWEAVRLGGFHYVVADKKDFAEDLRLLRESPVPSELTIRQMLDTPQLAVFEVRAGDNAPKPAAACRQTDPPAWEIVRAR